MGDKSVSLTNIKDWQLSISGEYDDPSAYMKVDNFFLLEVDFLDLKLL